MNPWIQTYAGIHFDLLDPQPDMVDIRDIAHSLAHQVRFNGHSRDFYTVAEHSIHVSHLVSPDSRLQGLLHDAAEAYVGDMVTPLKNIIPEFRIREDRVWRAIAEKFHVSPLLSPEVKRADSQMLMAEAQQLLGEVLPGWGVDVPPAGVILRKWSPKVAKWEFYSEYLACQSECGWSAADSWRVPARTA